METAAYHTDQRDRALARFTVPWQGDGSRVTLISRATDELGRFQSTRADWKPLLRLAWGCRWSVRRSSALPSPSARTAASCRQGRAVWPRAPSSTRRVLAWPTVAPSFQYGAAMVASLTRATAPIARSASTRQSTVACPSHGLLRCARGDAAWSPLLSETQKEDRS